MSVCLTGLWVSSLFEGDAVGQQPVLIEDGSGKFAAVNTDQASDAELSVGDVVPDIVLIGIDAKPFRLSEGDKARQERCSYLQPRTLVTLLYEAAGRAEIAERVLS